MKRREERKGRTARERRKKNGTIKLIGWRPLRFWSGFTLRPSRSAAIGQLIWIPDESLRYDYEWLGHQSCVLFVCSRYRRAEWRTMNRRGIASVSVAPSARKYSQMTSLHLTTTSRTVCRASDSCLPRSASAARNQSSVWFDTTRTQYE